MDATRRLSLAQALLIVMMSASGVEAAAKLTLETAAGGITISGARPNFTAGFGNMNGLGAGTPAANVTIIASGVSGGVLYTTPYSMYTEGFKNGDNNVTAYVSTNFSHPTILIVKSCPYNTNCAIAANYSTMSANAGSPTVIIPQPGVADKSHSVAYLGIYVADTNGGSAFTGADSATITFTATNFADNPDTTDTNTLTLNSQTLQNAVRFTLATNPGGLTVSAGSDYAMNYSTVNGIGISPAAGLTAIAAAGGQIYTTPYDMTPEFSSFASTTGSMKAYVSTDFAHPSILELRDATTQNGAYTAISKASGSQTSFGSSSSGSTATRYLGLFVSGANGAGTFVGADAATVTFTLTVP